MKNFIKNKIFKTKKNYHVNSLQESLFKKLLKVAKIEEKEEEKEKLDKAEELINKLVKKKGKEEEKKIKEKEEEENFNKMFTTTKDFIETIKEKIENKKNSFEEIYKTEKEKIKSIYKDKSIKEINEDMREIKKIYLEFDKEEEEILKEIYHESKELKIEKRENRDNILLKKYMNEKDFMNLEKVYVRMKKNNLIEGHHLNTLISFYLKNYNFSKAYKLLRRNYFFVDVQVFFLTKKILIGKKKN
jgi:hypothetical protein